MTKREFIEYLESLDVPDTTPIMTNDYEYGISEVTDDLIEVKKGEIAITLPPTTTFNGALQHEKRSGVFIIIN